MKRRELLAGTALGILLPGCGGGGGGGGGFAGIGSGGTGISPGGIGSGGTGVVITSSSVGPVDGFGSIIVNGVRWDTSATQFDLRDVAELKLGVMVQVAGNFDPATGQGVATAVHSSADLRGMADGVDPATGSLRIKGVLVEVDAATVYAGGLTRLADLLDLQPVQVHGLPGTSGELRATRVELLASPGAPIVSGVIRDLDASGRTFRIGEQPVRYGAATLDPALGRLAEGQLVRVRGSVPAPVLDAVSVEQWSQVVVAEAQPLSLGGLVTGFLNLGSLRVDGQPVDASRATVSGGPASALANGVRVDATGTVRNGVLVATRIRLRGNATVSSGAEGAGEAEGEQAAAAYSATGPVAAFRSLAAFRIQNQLVDASRATFVVGGTLASLRNGLKLLVTGSRVVDDVLQADRVEFL